MTDGMMALGDAGLSGGGVTVGTQVEISLRGPHAGMDADDSLHTISQIIKLIAELERTEAQKSARSPVSRWSFREIRLGSLNATLEPLEIANDSSYSIIDRILDQMVRGFTVAETAEELPPNWTPNAAKYAAEATRKLGASPDVGMVLTLPGVQPVAAEVTQRSHQNLRRAVATRFASYGSRRGHLNGVFDTIDGQIRAVLRSEVGNERIPLECPESLRESLRDAWGKDRVEVTGSISENARGQVVSIRVHDLEILPVEPSLAPDELRGGFWPDMTDGLDARDHLAVIRGEA